MNFGRYIYLYIRSTKLIPTKYYVLWNWICDTLSYENSCIESSWNWFWWSRGCVCVCDMTIMWLLWNYSLVLWSTQFVMSYEFMIWNIKDVPVGWFGLADSFLMMFVPIFQFFFSLLTQLLFFLLLFAVFFFQSCLLVFAPFLDLFGFFAHLSRHWNTKTND